MTSSDFGCGPDEKIVSASRIIIVRGGGLGDFLLTLPIVFEALSRYEEVVLFTKSGYRELLTGDLKKVRVLDLDGEWDTLRSLAKESELITFWKDSAWLKESEGYNLRKLHTLEPRPTSEPHVTKAMFERLDWRISSETLRAPWLGDRWNPGNDTRWIHPGSGNPEKNAPFALFERRAREWLDRTPNSSVVFSFGEADESVLSLARASDLSAHSRVRLKTFETLGSFKNALVESASNFVGNDSGPCHLASMLGIPTDVFFRSTNPMVWKPLGPRVRVYLDDSGANRIL